MDFGSVSDRKYESGAIGHLEHGVALQGTEFSTELTVCESHRGGLQAHYRCPHRFTFRHDPP